jgi:hypothetical protein
VIGIAAHDEGKTKTWSRMRQKTTDDECSNEKLVLQRKMRE